MNEPGGGGFKLNFASISQSLVVALLLAVGATVWQTYQTSLRLPTLEATVAKLEHKLDEIRLRSDAADERVTDQINDLKVTLAVIEGRTNSEAARFGKHYGPAALER